jgi:hypothetical protein
MRYAQVKFTDNKEFILIKKAALDTGVSLETFIKEAIFEKLKLIADKNSIVDSISLTTKLNKEK